MRWVRAASIALLVGGPTVACSLLVDTGGLSDGPAPPDAGLDGSAESSADSGRADDAFGATDAAPSDAGADAPAPSCFGEDAGMFCDDFDHGPLGGLWSDRIESQGSLSLVDGGLSAPNALGVKLAGSGSAFLKKQLLPRPTAVRCELDLLLTDDPPAGEVDVAEILTHSADPAGHHLYLAHFPDGWSLGEFAEYGDGGALDRVVAASPIAKGAWVHVALETDGSTLTATYDGTFAGRVTALTPPGSPTSVEVNVGLTYASRASTFGMRVDNVSCTFHP